MAILMAMSSYSVAEAKNNLPKLLDRMLAGEAVAAASGAAISSQALSARRRRPRRRPGRSMLNGSSEFASNPLFQWIQSRSCG